MSLVSISSSGSSARFCNSRFYSSVSLLIDFSLSRGRFPGRDDPNDLLARLVIALSVSNEQNHESSGKPNRLPTLFSVVVTILDTERTGVFEHKLGGFEADAMLGEVRSVLLLVPFKAHDKIVVTSIRFRKGTDRPLVCTRSHGESQRPLCVSDLPLKRRG